MTNNVLLVEDSLYHDKFPTINYIAANTKNLFLFKAEILRKKQYSQTPN